MIQEAPKLGGQITIGDDPRITRVGHFLRKTKFDELPQLFNVLLGDMSLVGPRPEVRKYVEMFAQDYAEILRVRPGITDLASIRYRDEAAILGAASDPEKEYLGHVLPEKIQLAHEYVRRQSLGFDITIILGTLIQLIADRLPCNGTKTTIESYTANEPRLTNGKPENMPQISDPPTIPNADIHKTS
jgi:lipopolysaccharide/colanic/teichoic acid biosynthesis glycosyltransferase